MHASRIGSVVILSAISLVCIPLLLLNGPLIGRVGNIGRKERRHLVRKSSRTRLGSPHHRLGRRLVLALRVQLRGGIVHHLANYIVHLLHIHDNLLLLSRGDEGACDLALAAPFAWQRWLGDLVGRVVLLLHQFVPVVAEHQVPSVDVAAALHFHA